FFLLIPVRTAGEMAFVFTRALIAARRVLNVVRVEREVVDSPAVDRLPSSGELTDETSGLTVAPGTLTMLVADRPAETAAVADRLGRLVPGNGVAFGGVPLPDVPLAEVRRRILVSEPEPMLFTGTLRGALDPVGQHADTDLLEAMHSVAAEDVLES